MIIIILRNCAHKEGDSYGGVTAFVKSDLKLCTHWFIIRQFGSLDVTVPIEWLIKCECNSVKMHPRKIQCVSF